MVKGGANYEPTLKVYALIRLVFTCETPNSTDPEIMADAEIIPIHEIQTRILVLRGQRVLLDRDLAVFYAVTTGDLNQAVKRNVSRFPDDFCFQLTHQEVACLISQSVTSNAGRGGYRKLPFAFTEYGILMAASVLNSQRAVQMSIVIVRVLAALRRMVLAQADLAEKLAELEARVGVHDEEIAQIVQVIRQLATPPEPGPGHDRKIGFHPGNRWEFRGIPTRSQHAGCDRHVPCRWSSRLGSERRKSENSIAAAKQPVKRRSLTKVLRKKKRVGAKPGWPTVIACHQPAAVCAYPGSWNQESVLDTK